MNIDFLHYKGDGLESSIPLDVMKIVEKLEMDPEPKIEEE